MEEKEKAELSDLSEICNFLIASKELTIAKVVLNIIKRRNRWFIIKLETDYEETLCLGVRETCWRCYS